MIIGRLPASFCEACPCWPDSPKAWGRTEVAPTPAATLPSTDVFTKSRREKVTDPPENSGLIYTEVYGCCLCISLTKIKTFDHRGDRGTQEAGRISRLVGRVQVGEPCLTFG